MMITKNLTPLPAVILARGGSKGIPNKNIKPFCGRALLEWTIDHALESDMCSGVWLSTDDIDIAQIALKSGANIIDRPDSLSTDESTSESGWIHAIQEIKSHGFYADSIVALQPTSPLRKAADFNNLVKLKFESGADSVFTGSVLDDLTLWEESSVRGLSAVNHDPRKRFARQDMPHPIVENGSMYLMDSALLEQTGSRFHGITSYLPNAPWQMHEIDTPEGFNLCEILMNHYVIAN